jgi:hypothetical protein
MSGGRSQLNHTYVNCHTYNISISNETDGSSITPELLQTAFNTAVISPEGVTYRIFFGCIYIFIFAWSSWQYAKHGIHKKLWIDNRQIVVLCILITALFRSVQFFLKVQTDCNSEYKWFDELLTALETIAQFTAFTLLISFWIELQLNVKQGLKSLQKLKRPTTILLSVFFVVRMTEFIFIVLSKRIEYFGSTSSLFATLALLFRILNVCLYGFLLCVATYWGYKLLSQLRHFERKTRESNDRMRKTHLNLLNLQQHKIEVKLSEKNRAATDSAETIKGNKDNKDSKDQNQEQHEGSFVTHRATTTRLARGKSKSSTDGVSDAALAKQKLFHSKVLRMTLFMILEVCTYLVWLVLYGVLFTMRGRKPSAKIAKPGLYLSIKYVEKLCEWLTIVVLCFTMIASSQSRKARNNALNRTTSGKMKTKSGAVKSAIRIKNGLTRQLSRLGSSRNTSSGGSVSSVGSAGSRTCNGGGRRETAVITTHELTLTQVTEVDEDEQSSGARQKNDGSITLAKGEMKSGDRACLRALEERGNSSRTSSRLRAGSNVVVIENPLEKRGAL